MSFLHAQNEKGRFEFPLCGGDGMTTKESPEISELKACESYRLAPLFCTYVARALPAFL